MQQQEEKHAIILAGATGDLGHRIANYIISSGATVKALIRKGSDVSNIAQLQEQGVIVEQVDFSNETQLAHACKGGTCLVSALSGVRDVIVELQTRLLNAAITAGIPRFIPSDYCIDYTKLPYGSNRNLDFRREFNERLEGAPIAATSILNGMFTNLLTGQAPVILFGVKRIAYWGDAKQLLDFTTIENTAEYTARAAMDPSAPRFLRIAGEVTNIHGLQQSAIGVTGQAFKLFRIGGLGGLKIMIRITRTLMPKEDEVFPPWQGMQYLHNMFTGLPKLAPLDNERYPGIHWTTVREVLQKHLKT
jgi:nucleoside-diphosphate-sugar epimerase